MNLKKEIGNRYSLKENKTTDYLQKEFGTSAVYTAIHANSLLCKQESITELELKKIMKENYPTVEQILNASLYENYAACKDFIEFKVSKSTALRVSFSKRHKWKFLDIRLVGFKEGINYPDIKDCYRNVGSEHYNERVAFAMKKFQISSETTLNGLSDIELSVSNLKKIHEIYISKMESLVNHYD